MDCKNKTKTENNYISEVLIMKRKHNMQDGVQRKFYLKNLCFLKKNQHSQQKENKKYLN